MTVTEKIIAAHCGKEVVRADEFVYADVDIALGNDITAPLAIEEFRKTGVRKVFDRAKIVLVPDHFTPNKDIQSARQAKLLREFALEQDLEHYFEVGRMGVEHALLPEQGIVVPGDLVIGADSHTCTYGALCAFATGVGSTDLAAVMATGRVWLRVPRTRKFVYKGKLPRWVGGKDLILFTIGRIGVDGALYQAIEFTGQTVTNLSMEDRLSMCNMVIECGGKNGIVPFDDVTREYERGRAKRKPRVFAADNDAGYADVTEYDVSGLEPQVAAPHLPSNVRGVREFSDVRIDQVVVGSCTNGRISDLAVAAGVMKGRSVAPHVRMIVIPATQQVFLEAAERGYTRTFIEAGAVVSTPTCGPCLGGHMGILAEGEVAVATTNRNFVGRMGHPKSSVYLANPAVAAASAVTGRITHPDDVA
jgi:3-isopropylmalate/(R)-2-methylmalate dehydratase large subunit